MNGGAPEEDTQSYWKILPYGSKFFIVNSGVHGSIGQGEYHYATRHSDGNGRRYIHTWMNGGPPEKDAQAHWKITPIDEFYAN